MVPLARTIRRPMPSITRRHTRPYIARPLLESAQSARRGWCQQPAMIPPLLSSSHQSSTTNERRSLCWQRPAATHGQTEADPPRPSSLKLQCPPPLIPVHVTATQPVPYETKPLDQLFLPVALGLPCLTSLVSKPRYPEDRPLSPLGGIDRRRFR